jgi:hypothetical protein
VLVILTVTVAIAATPKAPWYTGPDLFRGWVRWDAGWYRSIVDNGYYFAKDRQSSVAYFPVYPLVTEFLADVLGGDPSAWGVAVTIASGLVVAVLFHRWCRERMSRPRAATALLCMVLWPYAFYLFGAVYADALFLAMVLLAFTFVERDQPVLAAVAGAVATATRPVGAAVVVGLVLRTLERRGALRLPVLDKVRWLGAVGGRAGAPAALADRTDDRARGWITLDLRRLRRTDPAVVLSICGLLAYMLYLWHEFGEPFAFAQAESAPGWDQDPGPRVWLKFAWWSRLLHLPGSGPWYFTGITIQAALAAGLLLLVPLVLKRFGWAYATYTVSVLAIPLIGSKDFMGIGRYSLAAFPSFAILGELLATRPRARAACLVSGSIGLVALAAAFSRNGYVA